MGEGLAVEKTVEAMVVPGIGVGVVLTEIEDGICPVPAVSVTDSRILVMVADGNRIL